MLGELLTGELMERLYNVVAVATRFAAGQYDQRLPAGATDEIGQLEAHLNQIAEQLVTSMAREKLLVEQNACLEEQARLARDLQKKVREHIFERKAREKHLVEQNARMEEKTRLSRDLPDNIRKATCGESEPHSRIAARMIQEVRETKRKVPHAFAELTPRELEVLHLLATGQTNAIIATQLVLSEKTVRGYVSNILRKVHLHDRTQVAVFAWQQGLMERD